MQVNFLVILEDHLSAIAHTYAHMARRGKLRSGDDAYPAYSLDFCKSQGTVERKKTGEEAIHPKKFERGRLRRVRNG